MKTRRRGWSAAAGLGGVNVGLVLILLGFASSYLKIEINLVVVVGLVLVGGAGPIVLGARLLLGAASSLPALAAVPDDEEDEDRPPTTRRRA